MHHTTGQGLAMRASDLATGTAGRRQPRVLQQVGIIVITLPRHRRRRIAGTFATAAAAAVCDRLWPSGKARLPHRRAVGPLA